MTTIQPNGSLRKFIVGELYRCNEEDANVYESDDINCGVVLFQMRNGEHVVMLDEVSGTYMKVLTQAGVGWVHYVDISCRE